MKKHRLLETVGLICLATASINCAAEDTGPATCAEAKSTYGVAVDGPQTLYIGGDKALPWQAYCAEMASAKPVEYLELDTHDGQANFSTFTEQTASGSVYVKTVYHRVRIDPVDLTVDTTDNAYAVVTDRDEMPLTNSPTSKILGMHVDYMPYGAAEACAVGTEGITADGVVDLDGTPFEVANTPCQTIGDNAIKTGESRKQQFGLHAVSGSGTAATCGRAALNCLPEPTVNGEVGNQGLLQLHYRGFGTPGIN